jgi:hypothetical protein
VLPACREDEGTGKCRLSVGIMRAMGLSLAAPLLLRTPDNKVRRAFPRSWAGPALHCACPLDDGVEL